MTGGLQFYPMLPGRTSYADMAAEHGKATTKDVHATERKRKEAEARAKAISKLPSEMAAVSMPGGGNLGSSVSSWAGNSPEAWEFQASKFSGDPNAPDMTQGYDAAKALVNQAQDQKLLLDMSNTNLESKDKMLKEQEMKYNQLMSKATDPTLSDGMRNLYRQQAESLEFQMKNTKMAVNSAANTQASIDQVAQMQRGRAVEQENSEKALWGPIDQAMSRRDKENYQSVEFGPPPNQLTARQMGEASLVNAQQNLERAQFGSTPLGRATQPQWVSTQAPVVQEQVSGNLIETVKSWPMIYPREEVNRDLMMAGIPPLDETDWDRMLTTPSFQNIKNKQELLMALQRQWLSYAGGS